METTRVGIIKRDYTLSLETVPLRTLNGIRTNEGVKICITDHAGDTKSRTLTGIGQYRLPPTIETEERGYYAKVLDGCLLVSLGRSLVLLDVETMKVLWETTPDPQAVFEFYELEGDILLRGEQGVHRITLEGVYKWTFEGKDIWVSRNDKPIVDIKPSYIKLNDWSGNEYTIDYCGKLVAPPVELLPSEKDYGIFTQLIQKAERFLRTQSQWNANKLSVTINNAKKAPKPMNWIKISKGNLPQENVPVLVWIRYENDEEFEWCESEMGSTDDNYYIEPNSGRGWNMGSAKNYIITHWMPITPPVS